MSTLIEEHRIPIRKTGRVTMVTPEGLPRLIEVLKKHPGIFEHFLLEN